MNYVIKMIALVFALGVLVLQGCMKIDVPPIVSSMSNKKLCDNYGDSYTYLYDEELAKRNIDCISNIFAKRWTDNYVCMMSTDNNGNWRHRNGKVFVTEAKVRGLDCGVKDKKTFIASNQNQIKNKT